ncbi:MAG: methyltransferase [Spirochaetota bacterium]|nr:methyltransferase [Spirochaetota bacterium]
MKIRELQAALEELIFVGQAHKMGVIDELYKKPDTSHGLAERMGYNYRNTFILLEALVEMNYLLKDRDLYTVDDEIFKRLVDKNNKEYEGDFWQFLLYLINPWKTLPYVLKHGKPDESSYTNFSIDDFIRGMDSPWKKQIAPEVVDICLKYCKNALSVADIGGAPGTMARAFVERGLDTIIYDLPESMEVMKEELSSIQGITIETGDATESLPTGPYDIAFLGNLCHGQSPEDNAKIIKMCQQNLNDGGIIAIFDNIRDESFRGAALALHMITQSPKGNIYSKDEYYQWLENAGFKDLTVEQLSDKRWQIIIGYK